MIIIIPGQLISLLTFPGVVLHEISHRFFCDLFDIPVYEICYLRLFSRKAGHVIHAGTTSLFAGILISLAPLIINSLVSMFLLIPLGYTIYLKTHFFLPNSLGHIFLLWLGFSIGIHAIPSDQDMINLDGLAISELSQMLVWLLQNIVFLFNVPFLGFGLQIGYVYFLSQLLPMLFLQ